MLNLVAMAFAPATGGLSLAVVAPINIAVTVQSVRDYILQDALTNSAFDKAQALSQEEPSLFWLAVDIVGTLGDVTTVAGTAAKVFRRLAPLVRTAQTAKEGEEVILRSPRSEMRQ